MDFPSPIVQVPVTPVYVLAWFRDYIRLDPELGGPGESTLLTFDSTIREWEDLCGILHVRDLSQYLSHQFGMEWSWEDWREVLEPPQEKRFRGVCDLLAQSGTRPSIGSLQLGPFTSSAAGAFVAVREFLRKQGVDANQIAPSTLLAPYLFSHEIKLSYFLMNLAPGVIPDAIGHPQRREKILGSISYMLFLVSLLMCMLIPSILVLSVALVALQFLIWSVPHDWTLGSLRTFRDLSVALAAEKVR